MQELKLGDRVKVATGKYEAIYSFGHVAPSTVATFLHIRTSLPALRLTEDHMVFTTSQTLSPLSVSLTLPSAHSSQCHLVHVNDETSQHDCLVW
jgi:hypothetical protein